MQCFSPCVIFNMTEYERLSLRFHILHKIPSGSDSVLSVVPIMAMTQIHTHKKLTSIFDEFFSYFIHLLLSMFKLCVFLNLFKSIDLIAINALTFSSIAILFCILTNNLFKTASVELGS